MCERLEYVFLKTGGVHAPSAALCATSARGLPGAQTANFWRRLPQRGSFIESHPRGWMEVEGGTGGGWREKLDLPVSNSLKAAQEISPERRSAAAAVQESIVRVEKSLR